MPTNNNDNPKFIIVFIYAKHELNRLFVKRLHNGLHNGYITSSLQPLYSQLVDKLASFFGKFLGKFNINTHQ